MYSDAGLLGGLVVSEAATAGKAVSAVVAALRSVSVTEAQVAGAKKQLLADIYTLMEDPLQTVENMGVQVVLTSSVPFLTLTLPAAGVRRRDARREISRRYQRNHHRRCSGRSQEVSRVEARHGRRG